MEIEKRIYRGKITDDWLDYFGDLTIGEKRLAFEWDGEDLFGTKVHLRYAISNTPIIGDIDELLIKSYFGILEGEYTELWGTEWTGQYGVEDSFSVGDHNLHKELSGYIGKFCHIEIWWNE